MKSCLACTPKHVAASMGWMANEKHISLMASARTKRWADLRDLCLFWLRPSSMVAITARLATTDTRTEKGEVKGIQTEKDKVKHSLMTVK